MTKISTFKTDVVRLAVASALLAVVAAPTHVAFARQTPAETRATNVPTLQLPFETVARLAVIPVRVDGARELRCILDTGMPEGMFLFDPAMGEALELEYIGVAQVKGVGPGSKTASFAMGVTLEVGDIELANQRVIVMNEREALAEMGVDGVVGASIFSRYVVEFDFDTETITLYDPATFDAGGAGASIPLTITATRPYVDVEVSVDGDAAAVPVTLVVDTGAGTNLTLDADVDDRLGPPPDVIAGVVGSGVGGDLRGVVGRVALLQLGPHELAEVVVRFPEGGQGDRRDRGGTLGMGTLRRFVATIDYPNERLLLRPGERFGEPFEHNMAGLVLRPVEPAGLRVHDVVEHSPGSSAGLRSGDVIMAIDGRPIGEIAQRQMERLFTRPGETIVVTVDRDGERIEVAVELRRLI